MAKQSEAISLAEIAAEIPGRIHQILEPHVSSTPDNVALIEEGASWTYRELDHSITDIAAALKSLGIRAGDRMIIVPRTRPVLTSDSVPISMPTLGPADERMACHLPGQPERPRARRSAA